MTYNQPKTTSLSTSESLHHLSFKAETHIRQAFGESLDSAHKAGIQIEQLAAAFEPLLLRAVDVEAWEAIPELVEACYKARVSACDVLEAIYQYLPTVAGQSTLPLTEPLFQYVTKLVSQTDLNDIRLELNSLLTIQHLISQKDFFAYRILPFETLLKAATLEFDGFKPQENPLSRPLRPLEAYAAHLSTLSFAPEARTLLLAMVAKNNDAGQSSEVLRNRFVEAITPASDGSFLAEEHREVALQVCKYYMHQGWQIEPLLPVLSLVRTTEKASDDERTGYTKYLRELHSDLCSRGLKFETLSSHFIAANNTRLIRLDDQTAKIALALTAVLPTETPSTPFTAKDHLLLDRIKNAVYSTSATFKAINAREFDYLRLERLIRTLDFEAPNDERFSDACKSLLQDVRRVPFAVFRKELGKKFPHARDFFETAINALDVSIGKNETWAIHEPMLKVMERLFSYCYKHKLDLPALLENWGKDQYFSSKKVFWEDIDDILDIFMNNRLPLRAICPELISHVHEQSVQQDKQLVRLVRALEQYLEEHPKIDRRILYTKFELFWRTAVFTEADDQLIRMVERTLRSDELSLRQLKMFFSRDLPMYAIIQRRLALRANPELEANMEDSDAYNDYLTELENTLIINDHPPHIISDAHGDTTAHARSFYNNTLDRFEKMYDHFNGFSANMFDARSFGGQLPALAQFGLDCATRVHAVNASSSDQFPGRGYYIWGLLAEQFLSPDQDSPEWNPTYTVYKNAWPHLAEQMDEMAETAFLFTRGLLAVIPPPTERYEIDSVHYSYVAFNEHFQNYRLDVAYLVPTQILRDKVSGSLARYDEETGEFIFSETLKDINQQKLTAEDFRAACEEAELNLLNISWGSNHAGGLCNAFPPNSKPFHQWESMLSGETKDRYGHTHKSHRFGGYRYKMDPQLKEFLSVMAEAEEIVRNHVTRCHNFVELFQIAQAYWHRGYTLPRRMDDDSGETFSIELKDNSAQQRLDADERQADEWEQLPDSLSARMLIQAYQINRALIDRDAGTEEYPVLCITTASLYSSAPDRAVLDTLTMTYYDGYEWISLPSNYLPTFQNEIPDEALTIWQSVTDQVGELESKRYSLRDLRWTHRAAASHLLIDLQP